MKSDKKKQRKNSFLISRKRDSVGIPSHGLVPSQEIDGHSHLMNLLDLYVFSMENTEFLIFLVDFKSGATCLICAVIFRDLSWLCFTGQRLFHRTAAKHWEGALRQGIADVRSKRMEFIAVAGLYSDVRSEPLKITPYQGLEIWSFGTPASTSPSPNNASQSRWDLNSHPILWVHVVKREKLPAPIVKWLYILYTFYY